MRGQRLSHLERSLAKEVVVMVHEKGKRLVAASKAAFLRDKLYFGQVRLATMASHSTWGLTWHVVTPFSDTGSFSGCALWIFNKSSLR